MLSQNPDASPSDWFRQSQRKAEKRCV